MTKRALFKCVLFLGLALFCVVLIAIFASRSPAPVAAVGFLSKPYRMPKQSIFVLERWIPTTPGWGWLWRLKSTIFGGRKPVDLQASIIQLGDSAELIVSQLVLSRPVEAQSNGVRIWLIPNHEVDELRRELKSDVSNNFINGARISTADQIAASLFTGETVILNGLTNTVGLSLEMFPRVRHDSTDLTASILCSQLETNFSRADTGETSAAVIFIHTNLDLGARFQIPESRGVFLLDTRGAGAERKSTAVILSAKQPGRKH